MILVNGVLDGFALITIESKGTHAHLIHVSGTNNDSSSIAQSFDGGRVDRGNEVCLTLKFPIKQMNPHILINLPLRMVEAAEDWRPFVRMLSLTAMGIPSSLDLGMSKREQMDDK